MTASRTRLTGHFRLSRLSRRRERLHDWEFTRLSAEAAVAGRVTPCAPFWSKGNFLHVRGAQRTERPTLRFIGRKFRSFMRSLPAAARFGSAAVRFLPNGLPDRRHGHFQPGSTREKFSMTSSSYSFCSKFRNRPHHGCEPQISERTEHPERPLWTHYGRGREDFRSGGRSSARKAERRPRRAATGTIQQSQQQVRRAASKPTLRAQPIESGFVNWKEPEPQALAATPAKWARRNNSPRCNGSNKRTRRAWRRPLALARGRPASTQARGCKLWPAPLS